MNRREVVANINRCLTPLLPGRGYRRCVSPRRRIALLVALAAAAAVALVGVAVVAFDGGSATMRAGEPDPRPGRPPLSLALGFRDDVEARDLERASRFYAQGNAHAAAALFGEHDSVEAKVGAAFATWPEGTYDRLEQLAKLYPQEAVAQFHLGLARLWAQRGDPEAAWRAASDAEPDTPYAVLAANLLYPKLPRGLPTFVPSFSAPAEVVRLAPERQLEALRRRAARGGTRDRLLYGVGLQRVGRPVSAASVFEQAAEIAPTDPEVLVAAAVGQFDKAEPARAFGQLGPLTRRFPKEPTVRFHLGLLLLWTGRIDAAQRQFKLASRTNPGSPLAREAARYLETIRKARS
jgi:tetratricopeptide (TPR) repeat protein